MYYGFSQVKMQLNLFSELYVHETLNILNTNSANISIDAF